MCKKTIDFGLTPAKMELLLGFYESVKADAVKTLKRGECSNPMVHIILETGNANRPNGWYVVKDGVIRWRLTDERTMEPCPPADFHYTSIKSLWEIFSKPTSNILAELHKIARIAGVATAKKFVVNNHINLLKQGDYDGADYTIRYSNGTVKFIRDYSDPTQDYYDSMQ